MSISPSDVIVALDALTCILVVLTIIPLAATCFAFILHYDDVASKFSVVTLVFLLTISCCISAKNFAEQKAVEYSNTTVATSETATQEEAADTVVIDGQTYVLQNDDDGTAMQEEPADTVEIDGQTYVLQDDDDFPYLGLLFFVIFLMLAKR